MTNDDLTDLKARVNSKSEVQTVHFDLLQASFQKQSYAVDLWSFGVVLVSTCTAIMCLINSSFLQYEVMTAFVPFPCSTESVGKAQKHAYHIYTSL